jgi:SAM-dependent methyltransferase
VEAVRRGVDKALSMIGLVRAQPLKFAEFRNYIPLRETIEGAEAASLSVGDYIDEKYGHPGSTQSTIEQMKALGVFDGSIERICEIGPGSGRYLAPALELSNGATAEIYETATEWNTWLVGTYGVSAREADGSSLAATASESVDLVQAHKVLVGQPSLGICSYLREMARVLRPQGHAVFDLVTEECLDEEGLAAYDGWDPGSQSWPNLFPKAYAVQLMKNSGCEFIGSFRVQMRPGTTECMVFKKIARATPT